MDPTKKISFGFSKLTKKPAVVRTAPVEQKKVELVECLEGQFIKIKDAVEIVNEPLVIPIKDNKRNLLDRVREAKAKQKELVKKEEEDTRPDSELSLEELAARELINEAKNRLSNKQNTNNHLVLPVKVEQEILEGEKEPTLDDYENVPVGDYGMAMLRGMGWKEGMGIGRSSSHSVAPNAPELRPKGLGLGATKMVNVDTRKAACDKDGKELVLKPRACAKIIAGTHKGEYCEVQGLDDEAGTVIVRTSLKGEILILNEFLMVPVTNEEYSKGSKVLNNAKFEEYKEMSDKKLKHRQRAKSNSSEERSENNSRSRYSSDDDKYLRVKQASSRKVDSYDYGKASTSDKHEGRTRSKYREKERYRSSSSESDSDRKQRKSKKNKKSRHRERSRSREAKHKKSAKIKTKSSSSDSKDRVTRKKNKSKSRYRESSSSSSDRDCRS